MSELLLSILENPWIGLLLCLTVLVLLIWLLRRKMQTSQDRIKRKATSAVQKYIGLNIDDILLEIGQPIQMIKVNSGNTIYFFNMGKINHITTSNRLETSVSTMALEVSARTNKVINGNTQFKE